MRSIILLIYTLVWSISNAQTWKSIPKTESFKRTPRHFKVNPYQNQLWFIWDEEVNMIEENGTRHTFSENELGELWIVDDLSFAFTPTNIYYSKDVYGLYSFDNFVSELVYSDSNIRGIKSNFDTIYIKRANSPFYKLSNDQILTTNKTLLNLEAKNEYLYADIGIIAQINGPNSTDWNYLYTDPEYLQSELNYFCFSRNTDTFYLASKLGISFAYNYDFLDTITPNNTTNMPSANVLEMEFDLQDRLVGCIW
jgi:hypothetical protein